MATRLIVHVSAGKSFMLDSAMTLETVYGTCAPNGGGSQLRADDGSIGPVLAWFNDGSVSDLSYVVPVGVRLAAGTEIFANNGDFTLVFS